MNSRELSQQLLLQRARVLLAEARRRGLVPPPTPAEFAASLAFYPDPWQQRVLEVERNTLLNCSRQAGKSTTTSLLATYRAVTRPGQLILLVSPSQRQSSELFRKVRDWFDRRPELAEFVEDNILSCELKNGSRIVSLPGSEATIRGFSAANLVIVDEASRVEDGLFVAVSPMLAVSHGQLIMMSTPFGKRGSFWKEWSEGGDAWERIEVPATMIPRIPADYLAAEKRRLGVWFDQEYMCKFLDDVNSLFGWEMIAGAFDEDIAPLFGRVETEEDEVQRLWA